MILKFVYMYTLGIIEVTVEGFFIEKFITECKNKGISLYDVKIEKGVMLKAKISRTDFESLKDVANTTSSKIEINNKKGLPFLFERYKKRKLFAITILVIAIFSFIISRFIWNIEIVGNDMIPADEILSDLAEYGIEKGKIKSNLDLEKIKNEIRLKRSDLSWIGIDIKGTNVIVTIVEAIDKPEVLDRDEVTNIIADKSGVISKMIVRSGTARVNVRR